MHPGQGMTAYRRCGKWLLMLWVLSLSVLVAMTAVMLGAWAFGLSRKNGGWTDVFWTFGTGIVLALAALCPALAAGQVQARQWLVGALVLAWAARVGGYLAPP